MAGEAVPGLSLALAGAVAGASWFSTGIVRRYAIDRGILDRPTPRSAHRSPIPRGGGLGIAVALFAGLTVGAIAGWIEPLMAVAMVGGGCPIAIVGWVDDRKGLSPWVRLLVHTGAAVLVVQAFGGFGRSWLWAGSDLGWVGSVIAVAALVWSVNLYNFMDGLDGFAAAEAVQVGCAGALLSAWVADVSTAVACMLVAAGAVGFLPWNWSPARIFLGDVGSGLFGFLFGVIALGSERTGGLTTATWLILLAVFGFDATVTLIRRLWRGERWYAAHQDHAYQRLARSGWSHAKVVFGLMALNSWLLGVAAVAVSKPRMLGVALGVATVSVAFAYVLAGRVMARPDAYR